MAMSEAAKEARRIYMRGYRKANRERINEKQREWQKNNPDKVKASKERHYEKMAIELGISK